MTKISGTMGPELAHSCATARPVVGALYRRVLADPTLPRKAKVNGATATIQNMRTYVAGVWPPLAPQLVRKLRTGWASHLRAILKSEKGVEGYASDGKLCAQLGLPPMQAVLVCSRLRAFRRMITAPAQVRALLQSRGAEGWRDEIRRSLAAIKKMLPSKLEELPNPAVDTLAWENMAVQFPTSWHSVTTMFLKAIVADPPRWALVSDQVWGTSDSSTSDEEILCHECTKTFKTHQGLQSHRARVHQWRHPLRAFVPTSVCPVCQYDFRSRLRALQHVQRSSTRCRQAIESGAVSPADPEVLLQADREEQEWRVSCREAGVSPLSGPPCLPPM